MSDSSSERNPVEKLAEEFLERYRRGERPALGEYVDRYPELAEQIRDLFPALVLMEDVRPDAGDVTGDLEHRPAGAGGQRLERLGDYRILREVGHGGMGIVYEAEQESLGRHVALKVLLTHSLLDPKQLQRFHREARAAARLHHTHIVPVYGVGENDGFHYYIMQFIQGQGLDQVLKELKRLREIQGSREKPAEGSAAAAAQGLLTGRYRPPGEVGSEDGPDVPAERAEVPEPQRSAASSSSATIHLPGQAEHSALTHSSRQFFHSVARIGVQVAEALAYAHGQGILHRDIKPSNLLLDTQGTVWVTDFGLAKAAADADLTHTGDIVGTLRYMAPERFNGQADMRSDLYSLGLTLYELLTLRPAFDERNRNKLIQQVMHDEPPRPRKLNPAVPRDLETVVLKAIARDPAQRYQTPTELADDLKRFVEDRPIRARRAGAGERLWRWCRRNPALASLLALVQIALLALLVLAAWSYARISRALTETVEARDEAVAVSYRALLNETQALRLAHASGWRHQALDNLQKLAHLETPQRDLAELRSEAVACLGGFDANEETRFLGHTGPVWSLDFSPDSTLLATADYDGRLFLWDVRERRKVREVTDPAVNRAMLGFISTVAPLPAVRFRPGGDSLAYATWEPGFGVLGVGEADPKPPARIASPGAAVRYLGFDGKGKRLAVSWGNGRLGLYDAGSWTLLRQVQAGLDHVTMHFPVALDPDDHWLATSGPQDAVQLHPMVGQANVPVVLGRHRDTVRSLCFSPSGRLLASASEDQTVKLWKVGDSEEPITLVGHSARVNCVAFSPDESLLASACDDETVRLWETQTGQALMVLQPRIGAVLSVAISPDGRRLAAGGALAEGNCPVCVYHLTSRQEQRRLAGHTYHVNAVAFHPSLPLLASGSADRSILWWDLQTNRPARRWLEKRANPVEHLAFAPDGSLLAVGLGSFDVPRGTDYAIELKETATGTGRQRLPGPTAGVKGLAYDPSGTLLAAATDNGEAFLWDTRTGDTRRTWKAGRLEAIAFVRNGTRLVTGEFGGRVVLHEVADGQAIQETVVPGGLGCLAPAPGEQALVVGGSDGIVRILALPGLETSATLEKAHADTIKVVAFSPDGRLMASAGATDLRVVLWDARTYQRLCTLSQPSQVNHLAFDRAGRRLAICGSESPVTIWDLGLVNEELAAAGLDWDASLPGTGLPPGALVDAQPAPVTIVRVGRLGTGGDLKPPVIVVRPADRRRRTATADEIAGWVRQLLDNDAKVGAAAADALVEVGPPAIPALTAVTPRTSEQARAVLDRIAAAEVLAATRVRLKLQNALPADAVRALSEQSRIPMNYRPPAGGTPAKRIDLDLEDVGVWEALDRICEAADLGYSCLPSRAALQVDDNAPRPLAVRVYTGPFRLAVTGATYQRTLSLGNANPETRENLQLGLAVLTERNGGVLSLASVGRVTEARDPDGQPFDLIAGPIPNYPPRGSEWVSSNGLALALKAPQRRDGRIKVLKGVFPMEIMVRRQDLVTVPDLAACVGRTFGGAQGHRLTVVSLQPAGTFYRLGLRLTGPPGWRYFDHLYGVELADARGDTLAALNPALVQSAARDPRAEDLAWLAASPQAPSLLGVPWPALALARPGRERLQWSGLVQVLSPAPFTPVQLRFFRFERLKVEVPFELHDVPLP
jgi:WD40 repeat protein/serine/threonine protein kinase